MRRTKCINIKIYLISLTCGECLLYSPHMWGIYSPHIWGIYSPHMWECLLYPPLVGNISFSLLMRLSILSSNFFIWLWYNINFFFQHAFQGNSLENSKICSKVLSIMKISYTIWPKIRLTPFFWHMFYTQYSSSFW